MGLCTNWRYLPSTKLRVCASSWFLLLLKCFQASITCQQPSGRDLKWSALSGCICSIRHRTHPEPPARNTFLHHRFFIKQQRRYQLSKTIDEIYHQFCIHKAVVKCKGWRINVFVHTIRFLSSILFCTNH